jgi:hypothetical protein
VAIGRKGSGSKNTKTLIESETGGRRQTCKKLRQAT